MSNEEFKAKAIKNRYDFALLFEVIDAKDWLLARDSVTKF